VLWPKLQNLPQSTHQPRHHTFIYKVCQHAAAPHLLSACSSSSNGEHIWRGLKRGHQGQQHTQPAQLKHTLQHPPAVPQHLMKRTLQTLVAENHKQCLSEMMLVPQETALEASQDNMGAYLSTADACAWYVSQARCIRGLSTEPSTAPRLTRLTTHKLDGKVLEAS